MQSTTWVAASAIRKSVCLGKRPCRRWLRERLAGSRMAGRETLICSTVATRQSVHNCLEFKHHCGHRETQARPGSALARLTSRRAGIGSLRCTWVRRLRRTGIGRLLGLCAAGVVGLARPRSARVRGLSQGRQRRSSDQSADRSHGGESLQRLLQRSHFDLLCRRAWRRRGTSRDYRPVRSGDGVLLMTRGFRRLGRFSVQPTRALPTSRRCDRDLSTARACRDRCSTAV